MSPFKAVLFTTTLAAAIGCSSSPARFQPEAGAEGTKVTRSGLIYSIPATAPVIKMKLVSAGITKGGLLHIMMFFHRIGGPAHEYMDPHELYITLDESKEAIYPARVHASNEGKPMIRLAKAEKQAVELLYQLPKSGSNQVPFFTLNWKMHYTQNGAKQEIAQTERFNLIDKLPPPQGVGQDDNEDMIFPYAGFDDIPMSWSNPGWMWW